MKTDMAEQQTDVVNPNRTPDQNPEAGAPAPGNAADHAELLQQAERKAQEYYDAWLRAKAEADNVRKRAQIDVGNAHKYALEGFAEALLPVRDSLEAALSAENTSVESLRQGVELTLKQLDSAFDKFNIREINPIEQKFDPHQHQAMTTVVSDRPPNTVVHVLQKGYTLNDRVVRPALVTVSKTEG
jgi:molecular chaperone GrpE